MTNTAMPYHKKFNCSSLYAQFVCPLPKCKENIYYIDFTILYLNPTIKSR